MVLLYAASAKNQNTFSNGEADKGLGIQELSCHFSPCLEHHGASNEFVALPDAAAVMLVTSCHNNNGSKYFVCLFCVLCVFVHCSPPISFSMLITSQAPLTQQFYPAPLLSPSPFVVACRLPFAF